MGSDNENTRLQQPDPGLVRPVMRWLLLFATAAILLPSGLGRSPSAVVWLLLGGFFVSNIALTLLPRTPRLAARMAYAVVIADTFLVSTGLFYAGIDGGRFPVVFFVVLLLAAIVQDLPRLLAGATVVAALYLYLVAGTLPGDAWALLTRVPFLYVVALYFGHMAGQVRAEHERHRRTEREKLELQAFLEVTAATNSTLDLHQVLYAVAFRVAQLVDAMRCSILQVEEKRGICRVLASSDDPSVSDLVLDLRKYPEVRRAIETRRPVVINDIAQEQMLQEVRESIVHLGFESILILPLMHGENLLGMLFLRAAREGRPFTIGEIASCQVVANASANALRNAMLYDEVLAEARTRRETVLKLQSILDHFPDLICTTDLEGRLTEFSHGGEELLGLDRDQALGRRWEEFFPEPEARARLARLVREGEPLKHFETVARRKDGALRDVLLAATPLCDEAGTPYGTVGIMKNISELKAARGHLVQAEKLTALGEVVSGVAHELNNPLAGVLGYAQLLMRGPMDGRQKRSVERILDSALRCQKIVQNLLAFSRRYPSEKKYLGLNGLIEKTLDLKGYDLRVNNVHVTRELEADLPRTMLDFNQLQQVLLNLINNAQYAISRHRGQGHLNVSTRSSGGMVQVRVQDDGPGIAREDLPRIFDPFFTTKPVGEGTGLGLSISYGIVRDHGGRIWAESEPERGTCMVVELPIRRETAGEAADADGGESAGVPAAERPLHLLVVDDEPVILDLLVDALSSQGHRIDTAAGGGEALRKLERAAYDLLLLDLKMPDMDGRQVFETIAARWPTLRDRVVFTSGDTVHPDTRRFIEASGRPCLDKPFRLEVLAELLAHTAERADARLRPTGSESPRGAR